MRALGFVVVALLASAAGQPFVDEDVRVPSPGKDWNTQTRVVDAPNLRAAFVKPRGEGRGSIITFGLDESPASADPATYVQTGFEALRTPPLSFKILKKAGFEWKKQPAFRIEYTDNEGIRHFSQVAVASPRGGIFVLTLQSPNEKAFKEDLPIFLEVLDGSQLAKGTAK